MHHRFIALPLAVLATLALAAVALAGGWAQVTVKDAPVDPPAGGETTLNLDVLQHGVTPVSWPGLTVVATDATLGTVVRTEAQAKGPVGSYVAMIAFPSAGDWTLTFESDELEMAGSVALSVAPAVVAAQPAAAAQVPEAAAQPAVTAPAAAPTAAGFDAMPLALALIAAAVAIALAALALRSREAATETRVSAGT